MACRRGRIDGIGWRRQGQKRRIVERRLLANGQIRLVGHHRVGGRGNCQRPAGNRHGSDKQAQDQREQEPDRRGGPRACAPHWFRPAHVVQLGILSTDRNQGRDDSRTKVQITQLVSRRRGPPPLAAG